MRSFWSSDYLLSGRENSQSVLSLCFHNILAVHVLNSVLEHFECTSLFQGCKLFKYELRYFGGYLSLEFKNRKSVKAVILFNN